MSLPLLDAVASPRQAQGMGGVVCCAWCSEPVAGNPTCVNGVPFHWTCLRQRRLALRAERKPRRDLTSARPIRRAR